MVVGLLVSLIWAEDINRKLGLTTVSEQPYDGTAREDVLAEAGDDLNVHFVDVGQGDAVIIELPDEKKMIIDGGKDSEKQKLLTYIDETIRTSEGEKLTHFDYAVLTHPDEDHCGGLDDVLLQYPTEVFYRPNVLSTYAKGTFTDPASDDIKAQSKYGAHATLAYNRTLEAGYNLTQKNGIETEVRITDARNEEISLIVPEGLDESDPDYYTITFYAPFTDYFSDINDYSPILILEYHNKRIVLSGDAEKEAEAAFVQKVQSAPTDGVTDKYDVFDENYSVNVIKLGHHGSKTSSSQTYLETLTTPETRPNVLCIVSCALVNKYGHPSPETLQRLAEMGFAESNILSTSSNSSIALSVRGQTDEQGVTSYNVYFGADMVRYEEPKLKAGAVKAQWQEIVYTLVVLVVVVFILAPALTAARKKYRKLQRETAKRQSSSRSRRR